MLQQFPANRRMAILYCIMVVDDKQEETGRKIPSVDKFDIEVGINRPPGGCVRHENYMAALTHRKTLFAVPATLSACR